MKDRLGREYFESLYAEFADPWDFETSAYERRKYERTLDVLRDRRYPNALEVGGSIGVFTAMLAPLCDRLLTIDVAERAVEAARRRLAGYANVRVEVGAIPDDMPDGPFDLIVASEVLYYLAEETLLEALRVFERELATGGRLLAVHWRKETRTYPLQGDEVHKLLSENTRLTTVHTTVKEEYRLDLFEARS
jgi:protein-L-isoaspartate O-methyltransferase